MYNPNFLKLMLRSGVLLVMSAPTLYFLHRHFPFSRNSNSNDIMRGLLESDMKSTSAGDASKSDNITPADLQYLKDSIDLAKKQKEDVLALLKQPVINDFNTKYNVTQDWICKQNADIDTVVIIPSGRPNFDRRQRFRSSSIANFTKTNPRVTFVFFLAGRTPEEEFTIRTRKIHKEMTTHRDIVIADFPDGYSKLVAKDVSMMNWVLQYCPQAQFVLRFDDDVKLIAGIEAAWAAVQRHRTQRRNFILGAQRVGDAPSRDKASVKNALSKEEFAPDIFPTYVVTGSLGYPASTAKLLIHAARRTKLVPLDDVFMTGLCATAMAVPTFNDISFRFIEMRDKSFENSKEYKSVDVLF